MSKGHCPYAEAGYGYPESGQTVVNVTNGKLIRLLVDDEPFDVRYGELRSQERVLDLRAGILTRRAKWVSPAGRRVRVRSTRLVSFAQRAVAAIEYVVEAVDDPARFIVSSELVTNEALPAQFGDPRVAELLERPLIALEHDVSERGATLLHCTGASRLQMVGGMDHLVEAPGRVDVQTLASEHWARMTVVCTLKPGQQLRVVKLLAYSWSSMRSRPALRHQVAAALTGARYSGFEGCCTRSATTSTRSGTPPMLRSTVTRRCSRRCASGCSTCCKRARAPSAVRSRRRV